MEEADALRQRIALLEERNRRLEVLYETALDLGGSLQLAEVLDRILTRTLEALRSEIGSVLILDPDEEVLWLRACRGLDIAPAEATGMLLGEGISGWVAQNRKPILVEDVEADPRFARRSRERYTTRSLISTPLLIHDRLIGVMNVNNKKGGEIYTQEDLHLLVAIASQAAVAIENANLYEETVALTYLDSLTRLYNHSSFQKMLEREMERSKRYQRPLSLVVIDIDDFKPYNDRYGHGTGEEALRTIAQLICAQSRSSDILSRYGGDQFAALLPETESKSANQFADKVRESVDAHYFRGEAGDVAEHLTVSAGVAAYPEHARSHVGLLDMALEALFEAKFAGKNTVRGPGDL